MKKLSALFFILITNLPYAQENDTSLRDLYERWRVFETPPRYNGAPDYRQSTFDARMDEFHSLRQELNNIDTSGWEIPNRIDWMVVWAEMNGYDFNYRVLKPWERDPAFYKSLWTYRSDVPGHEGPTHHATTEIWQYDFPLNDEDVDRLISDLKVIPPLNEQARANLKGNARELWIAGIRHIATQRDNLRQLLRREGVSQHRSLLKAINDAISSSDAFVTWLEQEANSKTGPSGLGKENYSWYQQNVHLVPLSWEEEVMILKRELARAWSSLKLEESTR